DSHKSARRIDRDNRADGLDDFPCGKIDQRFFHRWNERFHAQMPSHLFFVKKTHDGESLYRLVTQENPNLGTRSALQTRKFGGIERHADVFKSQAGTTDTAATGGKTEDSRTGTGRSGTDADSLWWNFVARRFH